MNPTVSDNATAGKLPAFVHCHWYPWLVWTLGAAYFFAEYFAHVSLAVMVPQLMQAFHVGALSLGAMSAFFWYAYVSMQVPVGMLVDRYGPHRLMPAGAVLCAMGCGLFALAPGLWMAKCGRLLIGFGGSFAFVGTLKLAKIWFDPGRFGFLAGLTQAVGMLGAVVGEAPVAMSVSAFGWRPTMWTMAVVIFLIALLMAIFLRGAPSASHASAEGHAHDPAEGEGAPLTSLRAVLSGLVTVLKNPQSWVNGLYVGLLFAPTAAFGELWGVNYLMRTYHISQEGAASAIGFIFIGWAVGGGLAGRLSDSLQRRCPVLTLSAVASFLTLTAALYLPMPLWLLFAMLFLYGVANTGVGVSYALAGEMNDRSISGISMSFANMASVLIGAALQPLLGWFLEQQWDFKMLNHAPVYSAHAYRVAMLALPACLLLCIVVSFLVKETHCTFKR